MQISLAPKLEDLVRRKVDAGLYGDASEVVAEALRRMAAEDELAALKLERLRRALIAGETSGFVDDFSIDGLIAQLDDETSVTAPDRG